MAFWFVNTSIEYECQSTKPCKVENEFDKFWNDLAWIEQWKSKYYNLIVKYKRNSIQYWVENERDVMKLFLINDLKMNMIHCKYYLKQLNQLKIKYLNLEQKMMYL